MFWGMFGGLCIVVVYEGLCFESCVSGFYMGSSVWGLQGLEPFGFVCGFGFVTYV